MDALLKHRDQAHQLRQMVTSQDMTPLEDGRDDVGGPHAKLLVVTGGKCGVGTTTIAVNVAAAMARRGTRVVLVDLDWNRNDVANMCGLEPQMGLADVIEGTRPITEALQLAPAGLRVLGGANKVGASHAFRQESLERLIATLRSLGRSADCIIADAGCGATQLARTFWRAADAVLLVTTPDAVALMDSYATAKALLDPRRRPRLQVVVNQAVHELQAQEVYQRLSQSCGRFLGQRTDWAGFVPLDPALAALSAPTRPAIMQSPTLPSSRALDRVATHLNLPAQRRDETEAA
jgi:flagellar biosynthesis protein FlhG